jgi:predicted RNA binding protein YcfA (HicA-like mRNA interferase family)
MTRRLAGVRPRDVVRALQRAGFTVHRIKGSHHHLRHPDKLHLRVSVPMHQRDLPPGTLRAIIRQADLTVDEFLDLV